MWPFRPKLETMHSPLITPLTIQFFFAMATSYSCVVGKGHPKFDKASVQAGVDADAISYEDYLNSKGETVVRKLSTPGVYSVYCDPHAGAGMKMTITVQ